MDLIGFSEQDDMYVLGDMVDRGPDPIPLLQDLLLRPNIYPMLGNHEYMAMEVLRKLNTEITEENFESHLSEDDFMNYMYWMEEGGDTTVNQFARLDEAARGTILEYLEECAVYEELKIKGRKYVLVHADVPLHAEADVDAEPVRERENVPSCGICGTGRTRKAWTGVIWWNWFSIGRIMGGAIFRMKTRSLSRDTPPPRESAGTGGHWCTRAMGTWR